MRIQFNVMHGQARALKMPLCLNFLGTVSVFSFLSQNLDFSHYRACLYQHRQEKRILYPLGT